MDAEQIQCNIDTLLVFMNDEIESHGVPIEMFVFDFLSEGEERLIFAEKHTWTNERLERIVKICATRSLVKQRYSGALLASISLTEEGQSRAISVKHGKPRSYELGSGMQIATLNVHGPAQVGNGNVQNFENFFNQLSQQIDSSSATEEEKAEAKGLLAKLLAHPLVGSIVGGVVGGVAGNIPPIL